MGLLERAKELSWNNYMNRNAAWCCHIECCLRKLWVKRVARVEDNFLLKTSDDDERPDVGPLDALIAVG